MSRRAWFYVDTTFGVGGIATNEHGYVVDCAPIFRKTAYGREFSQVLAEYDYWRKLNDYKKVADVHAQ